MEDFTKLERYNHEWAICPNCGKLIKVTYHSNEPDEYDEYHGDFEHWETCTCKDCQIVGNTKNISNGFANPKAWKYKSKDAGEIEPTATKKQNNYMKFLASELGLYYNYISNKTVAAEWIKQALEIYTAKQQEEIYRCRFADIAEKYGFKYQKPWRDSATYPDILCFDSKIYKVSDHFGRDIEVTLNINTKTKTILRSFEGTLTAGNFEDIQDVLKAIDDDCKAISSQIKDVTYPTVQEARNKMEQDKADFKESQSRSCSYHDDYDDMDGFDFDEADLF